MRERRRLTVLLLALGVSASAQEPPGIDAAPARPDVLISLDSGGGMFGPDMLAAREYLRSLLVDPVAGGSGINYGYQEWSSQRTGSCATSIYVPVPVPDADQTAAVLSWLGCSPTSCPTGQGPSPWGGRPQRAALAQALNHYVTMVIPNDPHPCRKDIVLFLSDGFWNCTGDPCPTAVSLGNAGISVVAVTHGGVPPSALQCLATNSNGWLLNSSPASDSLALLRELVAEGLAGSKYSVAPSLLPHGQDGAAYSQTLQARGGTGTFTYAVTSGTLPPGGALSSAGVLSGTPVLPGFFTFTVTVTQGGCDGFRSYDLGIESPCPTVPPDSRLYRAISPWSLPGRYIADGCIQSGQSRPVDPARTFEGYRVFNAGSMGNNTLRLQKAGGSVVFTFSGSE